MSVRRWRLGGVVGFLLLVAAMMVQPAAASAESARSDVAVEAPASCPEDTVCAWTEPDFTGDLVLIDQSTLGSCWSDAEGAAFRSVWNATAATIRASDSPYCWGRNEYISPGTGGNTRFPVQSFSS